MRGHNTDERLEKAGGPENAAPKSPLHQAELAVSRILRIGVIAAAAVIVIGLVQLLVTGVSGYPGTTYPLGFQQIWAGVLEWRSMAVIESGLLLLILTPVLRVFVSLVIFLREKDYRFVVITSVVLLVLILSFVLGKAG